MKLSLPQSRRGAGDRRSGPTAVAGSVLIIVLWIAFGLVSITLYFANSMTFELRASDNRVAGMMADQAIEAAARYVTRVLTLYATNGVVPDPSLYLAREVPVGDTSADPKGVPRFWLIGRDTNTVSGLTQLSFGLIDEASRMNINSASSNMLTSLVDLMSNPNGDLVGAILDWRDTNGGGASQTYYSTLHPAYQMKAAPFDTVDELHLVQGGDLVSLLGEDLNRNGVLDANEFDENHNGQVDPGLLEYVTVYSREPGTYSNGVARVNVSGRTGAQIAQLLESNLGLTRSRAQAIGRSFMPPNARQNFASPLQFYRRSRMTADEFAGIAPIIRVNGGTNPIPGRININTASAVVLASLPGMTTDLAQTLISYRSSNPDKLTSVAWIVDALGQNNSSTLAALEARDVITTQSYQFTADVAAVGPYGRGYRRVRFVFDTYDGSAKIVYRQDLTHLGWALGPDIRQLWGRFR